MTGRPKGFPKGSFQSLLQLRKNGRGGNAEPSIHQMRWDMNGPKLRLLPKARLTRQRAVVPHAVAAAPAHAAATWQPASARGTLSALFGTVLFSPVLFGKPLFGKLRIFRAEGRGARLAALALLLATAPQTVGLAAPAASPSPRNPAPRRWSRLRSQHHCCIITRCRNWPRCSS